MGIYRRYASLFFIVGTSPNSRSGKGGNSSSMGGYDNEVADASLSNGDGNDENSENELGLLEFIHTLVETMDKWAGSICELDIMYQLEQVHFLVDEMVMNGCIVETNKSNILRPIDLIERESRKDESIFGGR